MLDTGHENVHRNVCKATREVEDVATQRGKRVLEEEIEEEESSIDGLEEVEIHQ